MTAEPARPTAVALAVAAALALAGCADTDAGTDGDGARRTYPMLLSEWGLFLDGPAQTPAPGVYPYTVVSPLFSDYAAKHRFIAPPPGEAVGWSNEGELAYPVGTVLVKTFAFPEDATDAASPERLVETRLLIREEEGWVPQVYLWDDASGDAVRRPAGARVDVAFVDPAGREHAIRYVVPNTNDCARCHEGTEAMRTLGPRAYQLELPTGPSGESQVDALAAAGLFRAAPPPADARPRPLADPSDTALPLDARARAYLHANCAHCHAPDGAAKSSGFYLGKDEADPFTYGVCRRPVAAGPGSGDLAYDIVPGRPDLSILVFRMRSTEPEVRMPELPNVLAHEEGVALVSAWIASMPPASCTPAR